MTFKNCDMPAMPQDDAIWCQRIGECPTLATGLTKREMMAMTAMQGLAANSSGGYSDYKYMAKDAVRIADALLAELERTNGN